MLYFLYEVCRCACCTFFKPAYVSIFDCICKEINWQYKQMYTHIFQNMGREFPESMEIAM